tara:strand:+ start:147 stop:395 length:249 start_codon:yes stop_codon:yes gene_type:complete
MSDLIIVFALIVQLSPDSDEQTASHWLNQKHCLNDARVLSRREENFRPALAYCKPVFVNPSEIKVNGWIDPNRPVEKEAWQQ